MKTTKEKKANNPIIHIDKIVDKIEIYTCNCEECGKFKDIKNKIAKAIISAISDIDLDV